MRAAVEALPGGRIVQPEVRTAVDDQRDILELRGDGTRCAVGQGQEDHVVAGEHLGGRLLHHPIGELHQLRLVVTEEGPGALAGRDRADLHLRVGQQQAEELTSRVTGRPRDRDLQAPVLRPGGFVAR